MTVREDLASLARDLRRYAESLEPDLGADREHAPRPPAVRAGDRPIGRVVPAKHEPLADLRRQVQGCTQCALHKGRRNSVFGEGDGNADVMFIGEAPGAEEDLQGAPFVGRAGQLLTKIIESIGLKREQVFIGNVLKCRPPGNRDPSPAEIQISSGRRSSARWDGSRHRPSWGPTGRSRPSGGGLTGSGARGTSGSSRPIIPRPVCVTRSTSARSGKT
jgi:hypothetical protein